MPIKKNQDKTEQAGKKNEAMNKKDEKPTTESNVGKNQKKSAQKPS
jgi:hypothetical protein